MLSVIIPTYNDIELGYLARNLENLTQIENLEVICVDGGSSDQTLDLVKSFNVKLLIENGRNRARRLNVGIENSSYDMVLLHHPRSFVEPEGIKSLASHRKEISWGGFTHKFDKGHWVLKFTSWYSNYIRGGVFGVLYLDHCIFFNKNSFPEKIFVPEFDIFEDTLLSYKLQKICRPKILGYKSVTSSVRFIKNGIFKQSLINQILKIKFLFKFENKKMNHLYEKGLNLNGEE